MDARIRQLPHLRASRILLVCMLVALGLLACGHDRGTEQQGPRHSAKSPVTKAYVFAIHPLHNPARLFEIYAPLIDYLSHNIPCAGFRLIEAFLGNLSHQVRPLDVQ